MFKAYFRHTASAAKATLGEYVSIWELFKQHSIKMKILRQTLTKKDLDTGKLNLAKDQIDRYIALHHGSGYTETLEIKSDSIM